MHLRQFLSSDQAKAETLIFAGLSDHFSNLKPELNPDVMAIQAYYVDQGHSVWVLEHDGELVGMGILKVYGDNSGEIVRVSVARGFRRRGIGRYLTTHLINQARTLLLHNLIVETNATWTAPIALYQQLGFVEYKRTPTEYDPSFIQVYFNLNLNNS